MVRARGGGEEPKLNQIVGKSWKRLAIIASRPTSCLELARLMSDPHAAHIALRGWATFFSRLLRLEKLTVGSPSIALE